MTDAAAVMFFVAAGASMSLFVASRRRRGMARLACRAQVVRRYGLLVPVGVALDWLLWRDPLMCGVLEVLGVAVVLGAAAAALGAPRALPLAAALVVAAGVWSEQAVAGRSDWWSSELIGGKFPLVTYVGFVLVGVAAVRCGWYERRRAVSAAAGVAVLATLALVADGLVPARYPGDVHFVVPGLAITVVVYALAQLHWGSALAGLDRVVREAASHTLGIFVAHYALYALLRRAGLLGEVPGSVAVPAAVAGHGGGVPGGAVRPAAAVVAPHGAPVPRAVTGVRSGARTARPAPGPPLELRLDLVEVDAAVGPRHQRRVPDVAEHGQDVGPGARGRGRTGCPTPSTRSGAGPRPALLHTGVGRRQGPDERGAELGLPGHRPAGPGQHVDELVGRGVALRRRLGDPALQLGGPLGHRRGQQVVLGREVAVDRGQRDVGGRRDVPHLHRFVPVLAPSSKAASMTRRRRSRWSPLALRQATPSPSSSRGTLVTGGSLNRFSVGTARPGPVASPPMSDPGTCTEREIAPTGRPLHPRRAAQPRGRRLVAPAAPRLRAARHMGPAQALGLLVRHRPGLRPELIYADVDYLGLADVWFRDLGAGRRPPTVVTVPLARGMTLPDRVAGGECAFDRTGLALAIVEEDGGTRLRAAFGAPTTGRFDADVLVPTGRATSR